jgi:hypothetical protein
VELVLVSRPTPTPSHDRHCLLRTCTGSGQPVNGLHVSCRMIWSLTIHEGRMPPVLWAQTVGTHLHIIFVDWLTHVACDSPNASFLQLMTDLTVGCAELRSVECSASTSLSTSNT